MVQAKKETIPAGLVVTESKCEVPLQNLLEHTTKRLVTALDLKFEESLHTQLELICKYGFDGTHANPYKQKSTDKEQKYDSMFVTSMVPLQLIDTATNKIVWKNPCTSSVRFCRPIKIEYTKENSAKIREENAYMQRQIDELHHIQFAGFTVGFKMFATMLDGKVRI